MDEDLPDSVDDNDNSDNDYDNDDVGIDEDNNDADEAGEYVNTSRLCERPAGCLLHSVEGSFFEGKCCWCGCCCIVADSPRPARRMINVNMSATKAPPKSFTCYLCQRAYGSASIGIHVKSCRATFIATEAAKPAKERRPVPEEHADYSAAASWTAAEAEAANAIAATRGAEMMDACGWCGRTFNPDRLAIHARSCTKEKPSRPVAGFRGAVVDVVPSAPPAPPQRPKTATTPSRTATAGGGGGDGDRLSSRTATAGGGGGDGDRLSATTGGGGGGGGAFSKTMMSLPRARQPPISRGGGGGLPPRLASSSTSSTSAIGEAAWAAEVEATWKRDDTPRSGGDSLAARLAALATRLSLLQSFVTAEFSALTAETLALAAALKEGEGEEEE